MSMSINKFHEAKKNEKYVTLTCRCDLCHYSGLITGNASGSNSGGDHGQL